jgi:transcriptional regulator with XRE-family HTH domain
MPRVNLRGLPVAMHGFGARLRQARREAGLSMGELAEEIGAQKSTISLAERDIRPPALAETVRMAEALGIRVAWLIVGEAPMRGRAVTILVEDNGDSARDIRRELSNELSGGAAPPSVRRRKSSDARD